MSKNHPIPVRTNVLYSIEVIATVGKLWENYNSRQIIEKLQELGHKEITKPTQITYIAQQYRKAGYKLPRKRVTGVWGNLIEEAIKNHGLKLEKAASPRGKKS